MSSHFPSSWRPSTRASIGEDLTTQNRTNQTSIAEDYGKKSIVSPDLSAPLLSVQRIVFTLDSPDDLDQTYESLDQEFSDQKWSKAE